MADKILHIVTPDDVENQILDWGSFQWLSEPRVTGVEQMVVGVGRITPGNGHTRHNHVGSAEFIYIMEGTAEQTIETEENGFEKAIMKPGDIVAIPDSAFHSTMNVGDTDLVFLACYLNAGPEQDIRAAAVEIIPPKNAK